MTTAETATMPDSTGAAPEASRTVLFDFDGVLMHGDAFYLFMRDRYSRSWLCKVLVVLTLPWTLLCLLIYRKWAMKAWVHVGLFGLSERRYKAVVEAFADGLVRRPRQFCRDGLHALRRHQSAGDRVIVVTGCEHVLVSRLLSQLGLSDLEVLASQLKPGWFGMRVRLHNVGRRKVASLAKKGVSKGRVAYSDSSQDIPMLKLADEAVLVNGTPRLCKKIEKALGRSVARVDWF